MELRVADNAEKFRYELKADNRLVGFLEYRLDDNVLALLHTFVKENERNQGYGERLVRDALDDVRARGLEVEPVCPFVVAYLRRHPEYGDLVA